MQMLQDESTLRQRHHSRGDVQSGPTGEGEHSSPSESLTSRSTPPWRARKQSRQLSPLKPYTPADGPLPPLSKVLPSARTVVLISLIALSLRLLLLAAAGPPLRSRPELSGPLTAYDRLRECAYLRAAALAAGPEAAASPYAGGVCRHSPLLVALFSLLPSFTLPAAAAATAFATSTATFVLDSLPPLLLIFAFELLLALSAAAAACTIYTVRPVPVPRSVLAFAKCAAGWALPPPKPVSVPVSEAEAGAGAGAGAEAEAEAEAEARARPSSPTQRRQELQQQRVQQSLQPPSPQRPRPSVPLPLPPLPATELAAQAAARGMRAEVEAAAAESSGVTSDSGSCSARKSSRSPSRSRSRGRSGSSSSSGSSNKSDSDISTTLHLSRPAPWLPAASVAALLCNPISCLIGAALSTAPVAPALLAAAALAAARGRPVAAGVLAAAAAHVDPALLAVLPALPAVAAVGARAAAAPPAKTVATPAGAVGAAGAAVGRDQGQGKGKGQGKGSKDKKELDAAARTAIIAVVAAIIVSFFAFTAAACALTPPSAAAATAAAAAAAASVQSSSSPLAQLWARACAWVWARGAWVDATWGAHWLVADTTPSVGLFWYLFLQLFSRFRTFFLLVLHAHPFVYTLSLLARLPRWPLLSLAAATAAATLFKPYPTALDAALAAATPLLHLPLVAHRARRPGALLFLLALVSCVGAAMWSLWIDGAAGNANFFFFQSVLFTLCAALGVVELISAARRLQSLPPGAVELVNAPDG